LFISSLTLIKVIVLFGCRGIVLVIIVFMAIGGG